MKFKNNKKSIAFYSFSFLAALAPVSVVWFRGLPVHSKSAGELWYQIFQRERGTIQSELSQWDTASMTQDDIESRWSTLKQSILSQGASQAEAKLILQTAKEFYPLDENSSYRFSYWPVLIERGYIQGKMVWVSIGAAKGKNTQGSKDWNYFVRVINPENPRELSSAYSANYFLPRFRG